MRSSRTRSNLAAALAMIAVSAPPAAALTLAAMNLGDMTAAADTIVRARCIDRTPTRTPAGAIESVARFEVLETVKGDARKTLEVRELGGRIDDTDMVVPGAPLSEPGDEVVLFLEKGDDGGLRIVGVALGYLPVVQSSPGAPVVRVSPHLGEGFESGGVRPVADFLTRVRRLAERPR